MREPRGALSWCHPLQAYRNSRVGLPHCTPTRAAKAFHPQLSEGVLPCYAKPNAPAGLDSKLAVGPDTRVHRPQSATGPRACLCITPSATPFTGTLRRVCSKRAKQEQRCAAGCQQQDVTDQTKMQNIISFCDISQSEQRYRKTHNLTSERRPKFAKMILIL